MDPGGVRRGPETDLGRVSSILKEEEEEEEEEEEASAPQAIWAGARRGGLPTGGQSAPAIERFSITIFSTPILPQPLSVLLHVDRIDGFFC